MVKYKNFVIDKLFEKIKTKKIPYKVAECSTVKTETFCIPVLTAGIQNQGLSCYVPNKDVTVLHNVISVSANGANSGVMFYQPNDFSVLQDSYAIKYKYKELNEQEYLYLLTALQKTIRFNFDWTNKAGWNKIKFYEITLPVNEIGEIDFKYMCNYVSKIQKECYQNLSTYLGSNY